MKYNSTKGISFLIAIGSYGGFHCTNLKHSLHLCLGFIAFTIFLYDVENTLSNILDCEMGNREILIKFMDDLRDYVAESGTNIAHDERDSSEFVDIFLNQLKP